MTWLVLHCVGLHYIVLGTLYIARLRTQETGSHFTSETVAHCNWTKTLTLFCIGKLNFPSCFTECFTDGHCGSINGRCIRNKCHCQDELILSHSRCIQNSKSKCHLIHSALHSLIYAFLCVFMYSLKHLLLYTIKFQK